MIVVVSCSHYPDDERIYHKEIKSLSEKKFKINYFTLSDSEVLLSDKYINHINFNTYDAVMCVGTFTFGHVKPPALDEFIRIIKNKGLICFTINEGIYEEYGFDKKIKELTNKKSWNVKEFFKSDYIASKDVNAWLCLAEIRK